MRRLLAPVVTAALLVTACGGGGSDPRPGAVPGGPTAPATTAPPAPDHELVKAALRKTRAAKTAKYDLEVLTDLSQATATLRATGAYDLGRTRATVEQRYAVDPPEFFTRLTGGTSPDVANSRSVITASRVYLQLPAWKMTPLKGRWMTFTEADLRKAGTPYDVSAAIFPGVLEMLAEAEERPDAPADDDPDVAHVAVPADVAFLSLPSGAVSRQAARQADVDSLTGTVDVEVRLRDGYVTGVSFDAADIYLEALQAVEGVRALRDALAALQVDVTVSAHGRPVRVEIPPASQVVDPDDLE